MQIFKEGRAPFLNFLRNLSSQVIILAFVIVYSRDLVLLTCCHPENAKKTIISLIFLLIWCAAAWANASIFIEEYLTSTVRLSRASTLLRRSGRVGFNNMKALLALTWRNNKILFLDLAAVFIILEFSFVVVIILSIGSADNILAMLRR